MRPRRLRVWLPFLLASGGIAACHVADGAPPAPLAEVRELQSPAGPNSGEPNLFAARDGRVHLSWLERTGERGARFRFATLDGGRWSEPVTIAEGDDFFVNWADFPSVVELPDGRLAAHWLQRSGPGTYHYDVRLSQSDDAGLTWSAPVTPHRDGVRAEHGFVSLFPWEGDSLAAVWLDGRRFTDAQHGSGHSGPSANEMMLYHTTVPAAGEPGAERALDRRVCECCQTSAALTSRGPVVVFRDRSPEEIRDIGIVRRVNGEWTETRHVHADGWRIEGCPVNGPAVAATGELVAVAWFTAPHDSARVNVAFSRDAGERFDVPVRVDDGDPIGRVAVMLDGDAALVTWLERTADGAEVRVRRVTAGGDRSAVSVVGASSAARASGFPRMARGANGLVFAWTLPGDSRRLMVVESATREAR